MQQLSFDPAVQNGVQNISGLPAQPSIRYKWFRIPAITAVLFTHLCIMFQGGIILATTMSQAIFGDPGTYLKYNLWLGLACSVCFVFLPIASIVRRRKGAGWLLSAACIYIMMSFSLASWLIEAVHYYVRPNGFYWSFIPLALMQTGYLKRFYNASPGVRQQLYALVIGGGVGLLMAVAMLWSVLF